MLVIKNGQDSKEYNKLQHINNHSLRYLELTENGAVVFKIKIQINKSSVNRALVLIDYLVSEYS